MENNSEIIGSCLLSKQISIDAVPTVFQLHETYIFIALDNGEIQKFNIDGTGKKSFSASQNAVWALATSGDVLASGGVDGEIEIWSIATGWVKIARSSHFFAISDSSSHRTKTLSGHTSTIRALVFLYDTNRIISASRDTTIRVWNIANGECTDVLTAHTGTIRTLALSRPGDLLLSGSHDGTACLWRILNNLVVLVHTLHGHEGAIYCVGFAESAGKQILTAGADSCVRIWDPENGKCSAILQGHEAVVKQIIIAGSRLITSDASGWIYIWSMGPEHEVLHRLQTHRLSVMSLDWDNTTILSGGKDGTVKLQDIYSGRLLGPIGRDTACVWKVGFLRDSQVALLVSLEGLVKLEIWDIN